VWLSPLQRDVTKADFMAAAVWSMMLRVVASVPHNDQPSTAKAFASRFPSRRPVAMQPEKVLSESHLKIAVTNARVGQRIHEVKHQAFGFSGG
jgi:hypothetical protein